MKSHVSVRQAVEGRKVEILLSPEDIESLRSGKSIQLVEGDAIWKDDLTARNEGDESLAIVDIKIDLLNPSFEESV